MSCFGWKDAFVLCRVFQKSGSGPKNGEKYGAPFVEEEWEDDEAVVVPGQLAVIVNEEVTNDNAFVEVNDIDQVRDFLGSFVCLVFSFFLCYVLKFGYFLACYLN